ncbi:hypothetical protein [Deinococcus marmoris]|uniref:hypothetical protein n=1 Tax=Deinococcus marmoris TaxID=249408 RepID=UPI0012DDB5BD|nr:hypothetical protein [Deinococcus marmoris]
MSVMPLSPPSRSARKASTSPNVRTIARAAVARGVDRNRPFQQQSPLLNQVAVSLLNAIGHARQRAQAAERQALGWTPNLAYDELSGGWHEVGGPPEDPAGPATLRGLADLVTQARSWAAQQGELPATSRELLTAVALVGALITGRAPGQAPSAFMITRGVLAQMGGCSEKTVDRCVRDARVNAAGLLLRGHAQITRCGAASGQARYDGSLVQLTPGGTAEHSRGHTALAWRLAAQWRPAFGLDIDEHQGAAGALREAVSDLRLRACLRDTAAAWLGLQAAMAALLALDPEAYFEWMQETGNWLDLAEMHEAERSGKVGARRPAGQPQQVPVAVDALDLPQPRPGAPVEDDWGGIEYFEEGLPDLHGWRRRTRAHFEEKLTAEEAGDLAVPWAH